jgi:phospholipid/cholesterol/gamma-HCH transport system substrate-binding protein
MDLHYKQELQVGLLIIFALALVIVGLLWLSGRTVTGRGRTSADVVFETVQGLTVGDPVQISGVSVGRVAGIDLERVGRVVVTIQVADRVRPRKDATASVKALDFLGAKYVAYEPGTSADFLEAGEVIAGSDEPDFAAAAVALGDRAAAVLARSEVLLSDEMLEQVRLTLAAAERAMDVMARVGGGPLIAEAEATLASVQRAAARLDSTLSSPDIARSVAQLDELTTNVTEMAGGLALATTALGQILQKMDSDQGTLGKLVNDSTLYQDMHGVLQSLKQLLDDIRERPGRYVPGAIKVF